MKVAVVFTIIVVIAFIGIYFMTNQNKYAQSQNSGNFLTPTPSPSLANSLPTQNPTATPGPTTAPNDEISATKATIKTAKGNIEFELYPADAPKTVTNFATLAKRGYYNNLTFHRVEDWVVQGGDPNGNGTGGTSIYGKSFEDELNPATPSYKAGYVTGVLAMANSGPNTNGSQFFILKKDTPLPHAYTIFGKVTTGMDIVNNIIIGDKILGIDVQQ